MTITRSQFARWLGWLGFAAFAGFCFLDARLQQISYGWLAYIAVPLLLLLIVFAVKKWGGQEAMDQSHTGFIEALVTSATGFVSIVLLLAVGVLIFLFCLSLWSVIRG